MHVVSRKHAGPGGLESRCYCRGQEEVLGQRRFLPVEVNQRYHILQRANLVLRHAVREALVKRQEVHVAEGAVQLDGKRGRVELLVVDSSVFWRDNLQNCTIRLGQTLRHPPRELRVVQKTIYVLFFEFGKRRLPPILHS